MSNPEVHATIDPAPEEIEQIAEAAA